MKEQNKGKVIDLIPTYREEYSENGKPFSLEIQHGAVQALIARKVPTPEIRAAAIQTMSKKAPPRPLYFGWDPTRRR